MRIINDINNLSLITCSVLTIGTYDGIHAGHKMVLQKLVDEARALQCESVVITFFPHPRHVLFPDQTDLKLIDTEEEKLEKFKKIGIDTLIIIPFTKEFALTSHMSFVEDFLVQKLRIKKFVLGKDHRFGNEREGGMEAMQLLAQKHDFSVDYLETFTFQGRDVSSTKIRKAISAGEVMLANAMLDDYFSVTASVVEGRKIGNTIGFPTANLVVQNKDKLLPCQGVYAVWVDYSDKTYHGMLNIGKNPSVSDDNNTKIEVHILNFDQQIYGETLKLKFVKRLRDEKKFNSLDELKSQLQLDKSLVQSILDNAEIYNIFTAKL